MAQGFSLPGSSSELHPDEIYGVDMSDGMLAQARARSSEVQWRKGPAEHLPFEDDTLDAVVTTSAFHFFDQPAALREFHRVLAPGGLAAVATLSPRQTAPPASAVRQSAQSRTQPVARGDAGTLRGAGLRVSDQHRVRRPAWTRLLSDLITVGIKP